MTPLLTPAYKISCKQYQMNQKPDFTYLYSVFIILFMSERRDITESEYIIYDWTCDNVFE